VLTVILIAAEHPPAGVWFGVTAWATGGRDLRGYAAHEVGYDAEGEDEADDEGRGTGRSGRIPLIFSALRLRRQSSFGTKMTWDRPTCRDIRPKDPAQVCSVQIPVGRLEQLRHRAAEEGVAPSALMGQWVIERLNADEGVKRKLADFEAFDDEYPGEPDEHWYETQAALMDATMPGTGGVPSIAPEWSNAKKKRKRARLVQPAGQGSPP